jgi:alkylation response protein AidB-like acyl-CoA dehydrogenase
MDFEWPVETKGRIDRARTFAAKSLSARPRPAGFDREAWNLCAREGVLSVALPKGWGGEERGVLAAAAIFEALGRGGADRGLLFALGAHLFGCAMTVARYATAGQAELWGRGLADGTLVAALTVTEPSGGSSASVPGTIATPVGEGFVITGAKTLVTNAPVADVFLLMASSSPSRGALGLTAFLLARDTPGLTVEPLDETLGLSGAPMGRVVLRDCEVGPQAVLGRRSGGFTCLQTSMELERTCILAGFLGAAERDLRAGVVHTRRRRDDHGSLFEHQAVSHRLARAKCRLESARWLLYRAAAAAERQRANLMWPAVTKLVVSEALAACALDVLQSFAGSGWLDESGVATALRDTLGTLSASGTSDVQLNVVAECLRGSDE